MSSSCPQDEVTSLPKHLKPNFHLSSPSSRFQMLYLWAYRVLITQKGWDGFNISICSGANVQPRKRLCFIWCYINQSLIVYKQNLNLNIKCYLKILSNFSLLFLAKVILVINYCTKFLASGEIWVSNNLPFRCIYYCPLSKIMNLGDSYDSFHSPSLTVNHSTGEMKRV